VITVSSTIPHPSDLSLTVRADLHGSTQASACGITTHGHAPVLQLCRKLIEAGHDPATPLAAYRGDTLCLLIHSIGEAAALDVRPGCTGIPIFCRRGGKSSAVGLAD
jgi:hypothetical protein